jgi:hypothetical protein
VPMPSRNRRPSGTLDMSLGGLSDSSAPGVRVLARYQQRPRQSVGGEGRTCSGTGRADLVQRQHAMGGGRMVEGGGGRVDGTMAGWEDGRMGGCVVDGWTRRQRTSDRRQATDDRQRTADRG